MKMTDRNCEKCVHHLSGYCDSWDCNMQTVDDVKREAVNEYIKAVVKELEEAKHEICLSDEDLEHYQNGIDNAIEIVKQEAERCNSGWILCSERLPEEAFGCLVTVMDCEPSTQTDFENILPYFVGYDGETWNDADGKEIPFEVIAWMPIPKPYKECD